MHTGLVLKALRCVWSDTSETLAAFALLPVLYALQ